MTMADLPSWVTVVVEVLYYAIAIPALALSGVLLVLFMGGAIAMPIWGAIFGRTPGERKRVEPLHPITRLVLSLMGLGLLWVVVAPWLWR